LETKPDPLVTHSVIEGDCLDVMAGMESGSVQMLATSPPYWGLRDYGGEPAEWGGDPACEHQWGDIGPSHHPGQVEQTKWKSADAAGKGQTAGSGQFCQKCGAWLGQLGLEPTPELYVEHLVAIFREAKRVLRDDGTLWLNLGDSYCSIGHKKSHSGHGTTGLAGGKAQEQSPVRRENDASSLGLKHKDLVGIPWRVAFALQADGWYLRSDIIWHKPNCMPESVTDRPTSSHEHVFLLAKSERYYYDADAIREPHKDDSLARVGRGRSENHKWTNGPGGQTLATDITKACHPAGRNARNVWTIPTQPFPGAHFAVWPEKLVTRMILAGSRIGDTVLDPFCGSGKSGVAAVKLGRKFKGIETNPEYCEMARKQIEPYAAQGRLNLAL